MGIRKEKNIWMYLGIVNSVFFIKKSQVSSNLWGKINDYTLRYHILSHGAFSSTLYGPTQVLGHIINFSLFIKWCDLFVRWRINLNCLMLSRLTISIFKTLTRLKVHFYSQTGELRTEKSHNLLKPKKYLRRFFESFAYIGLQLLIFLLYFRCKTMMMTTGWWTRTWVTWLE